MRERGRWCRRGGSAEDGLRAARRDISSGLLMEEGYIIEYA